jgi:hypothetical protein
MLQSDEQIPMSNEEILDYCYEIVNKPIFNNKLQIVKNQIINYIDNNCETDEEKQIAYDFLNIDTAFNLNSIITRLNELDVNNLLGSAENSFNKEETAEDVLNSFFVNYDENELQQSEPGYSSIWIDFFLHPVCTLTCNLIGLLSILWLLPLAILFGVNGLYVGGVISRILFTPIVYPMVFYLGAWKMAEQDSDLYSELWDIFAQWGLIGLTIFGIPWIIDKVYTESFYEDTFEREMTYYEYGEIYVVACLIWANWWGLLLLEDDEEKYGAFNSEKLEEIEESFSVMTKEIIGGNFLITGEVTNV